MKKLIIIATTGFTMLFSLTVPAQSELNFTKYTKETFVKALNQVKVTNLALPALTKIKISNLKEYNTIPSPSYEANLKYTDRIMLDYTGIISCTLSKGWSSHSGSYGVHINFQLSKTGGYISCEVSDSTPTSGDYSSDSLKNIKEKAIDNIITYCSNAATKYCNNVGRYKLNQKIDF